MIDAIKKIEEANPNRSESNLERRILKIGEELGELSEAYLNITSTLNEKNKTWNDVREEAIDILIIAADVALTVLETDPGVKIEQDPISHLVWNEETTKAVYQKVHSELDRKLQKWLDKQKVKSYHL